MKKKKLTISQQIWNKNIEQSYSKKKEDKTTQISLKEKNILELNKLKKQFFELDTDETIKKWEILSKAYALGKKIYEDYSVVKLSEDFDIPYTTVKRVLSLDKATPTTWNLINNKKITAFKVAQICMTKNNKFQDEIVKMVIKDNLSTYQIKKLRIDNKGNIKEARLTAALEKGFSRKEVAYKSVADTLHRLNRLLTVKKEALPESKIDELTKLMISVKERLEIKIDEFQEKEEKRYG